VLGLQDLRQLVVLQAVASGDPRRMDDGQPQHQRRQEHEQPQQAAHCPYPTPIHVAQQSMRADGLGS
jgi:hypothetical protein